MIEVKRLLKDGDILIKGTERYVVCSIINQKLENNVLSAYVVVDGARELRFSSADSDVNILYSRNIDYTKVVDDFTDINRIIKEVYGLFYVGSGDDYFFGDIITFKLVEGGVKVSLSCGIVPVRSSFGEENSCIVNEHNTSLSKQTIDWISSQIVVGNLERIEIHIGTGYKDGDYVERVSSIVSGTDDETMEFQKFLVIGRKRLLGRNTLLDEIQEGRVVTRESFLYYNLILKGFLSSLNYHQNYGDLSRDFYSPYGYFSEFRVASVKGSEESYELSLSTKVGSEFVRLVAYFDKDFKCSFLSSDGFFDLDEEVMESCFIRILEWFDKLPFNVSKLVVQLKSDYTRGSIIRNALQVFSCDEEGSYDVVL